MLSLLIRLPNDWWTDKMNQTLSSFIKAIPFCINLCVIDWIKKNRLSIKFTFFCIFGLIFAENLINLHQRKFNAIESENFIFLFSPTKCVYCGITSSILWKTEVINLVYVYLVSAYSSKSKHYFLMVLSINQVRIYWFQNGFKLNYLWR